MIDRVEVRYIDTGDLEVTHIGNLLRYTQNILGKYGELEFGAGASIHALRSS